MNLSSLMNQREFPITFTSFRCLLREIFGKKSWSSSEHFGQGYRLLYSEQFRFPNSQTLNSYKNEFIPLISDKYYPYQMYFVTGSRGKYRIILLALGLFESKTHGFPNYHLTMKMHFCCFEINC